MTLLSCNRRRLLLFAALVIDTSYQLLTSQVDTGAECASGATISAVGGT
jgi:hypothetical protein